MKKEQAVEAPRKWWQWGFSAPPKSPPPKAVQVCINRGLCIEFRFVSNSIARPTYFRELHLQHLYKALGEAEPIMYVQFTNRVGSGKQQTTFRLLPCEPIRASSRMFDTDIERVCTQDS